MSEAGRLTLTLHWRGDQGPQAQEVTVPDQPPAQLVPRLVARLGLPAQNHAGDTLVYELRLGSEQRPPLQAGAVLSAQEVRDGSRLWLTARPASLPERPLVTRCILRLPDGSEIVVPPRGQALRRSWLLGLLNLLNPAAFADERARFAAQGSAYRYVSDSRPHCTLQLSERGVWVVTTDRADVRTETAQNLVFEPLPPGVPVRLEQGMQLRLGGDAGLVIDISIL